MNSKKLERNWRVNLLGPGPCLVKKEFTGPRSHKGWETLPYNHLIPLAVFTRIILVQTIQSIHLSIISLLHSPVGPVYRSRYSDSLRAGRSGDRIPVWGEIFRNHPDRPWGPTSPLYNGNRVSFPGVKRPGHGVEHPLHLVPRLKKE